jgi:hypothetical protein
VAVATAGLLVVGALTACQVQPGAAAFIGTTRIPESRLDAAVDSIGAGAGRPTNAELRSGLLSAIVFNTLAKKYVAEFNATAPESAKLQLPEPTASDLILTAQNNNLKVDDPQNNDVVRTVVEAQGYRQYLLSKMPTTPPTDEQLQAPFQAAIAQKLAAPTDFAQFKSTMAQFPEVAQGFALQKELSGTLADNPVSVSPRYLPTCNAAPCPGIGYTLTALALQSGGTFPVVKLPFSAGDANPVVIDTLPEVQDTAAPITAQ